MLIVPCPGEILPLGKYMRTVEVRVTIHKRTKTWAIYTRDGKSQLGLVRWNWRWRQYCFYPEPDCVFSTGCLDDIAKFLIAVKSVRKP